MLWMLEKETNSIASNDTREFLNQLRLIDTVEGLSNGQVFQMANDAWSHITFLNSHKCSFFSARCGVIVLALFEKIGIINSFEPHSKLFIVSFDALMSWAFSALISLGDVGRNQYIREKFKFHRNITLDIPHQYVIWNPSIWLPSHPFKSFWTIHFKNGFCHWHCASPVLMHFLKKKLTWRKF